MKDNVERREGFGPKLSEFGSWVEGKVYSLTQGNGSSMPGYLQNGAVATSAIAKLRRNLGGAVGADPDIFAWTLDGIPEVVVQNQEGPTVRETVAYDVLTLFAEHQHSIHDISVHTDDNISFGNAVGQLAYGNRNEAGIRRRFRQLQTAGSRKERIGHARRLVKQLKSKKIQLNYALLADDLIKLSSSRTRADAVRLRWGRDFNTSYNLARRGISSADSQ